MTLQQSPSLQRHKKQRFWQILAPILLGGMITLAAGTVLMVLALTGGVSGINLSQVADTSLIWLILPVVVLGVVFGLIVFGMIYAAARLLNVLPYYTFLIQQYAALIEAKIKLWMKKGMDPVITVESVKSKLSALFSRTCLPGPGNRIGLRPLVFDGYHCVNRACSIFYWKGSK